MITNLIAAIVIAIVTNTTTTDNGHIGCPYANSPGIMCCALGCDHGPSVPATERTETTEIVKRLTIKFDAEQMKAIGHLGWAGGHEVVQDTVLSTVIKKFKRADTWIESSTVTNYPIVWVDVTATNTIVTCSNVVTIGNLSLIYQEERKP